MSIFLQQKYGIEGLADLDPSSGMNTTYQAYFRTLLTPDQNRQQHSTDKAAVAKYIRRRERRKRAEENKQTYELTDDILERVCASLNNDILIYSFSFYLANSGNNRKNGWHGHQVRK